MRPSQARDLAEADILVWMGAAQMPWLAKAQSALAANAVSIELMQLPDTIVLPPREGLGFAAHDDHADHSDHAPDPHAWLDPVNAQLWLAHIATALAAHDPDNAATYTANAEAATATLQKLQSDIATQLAPLQQVGFVVFHDAYQYFEARFGLHAIAALSQSDASTPGPSRVSDLRGILFAALVKCAFAEPQFNPRLMATLIEGTDIRTGILDPMGASLISGPMLYDNLLRGMADEMVKCLG
jgi:zinc transport system substrate-binding protein